MVGANRARLDRALVAHRLGRRISFPYLLSKLRRKWFQFGEFQVVSTGSRSFLCIFPSIMARDAVLQGGPLSVSGSLIGLDRWTPEYSPSSLQGLHSAVWVRLPQLPLLYWDLTNLSRIASILGELLWMDEHPTTWCRSSFARLCIRLDLTKPLRPGIWLDGLAGKFFQRFEYEGISSFCFQCGLVDHSASACPFHPQGGALVPPVVSPPLSPGLADSTPSSPSLEVLPAPSTPPSATELGIWNIVKRKTRPRPATPKPSSGHPSVIAAPPTFSLARPFSASSSRPSSRLLGLDLGPIVVSPRKRKKLVPTLFGGDDVPFVDP
ncbi:hypothetical protein M5K25_003512 [Dendrobium thyrsiflorum]|uniref:DUF4283 domain-containing protein n=1 Tax=Dendrobium thyrsiflorum TaxID=117978 RepID=A0ABD0VR99_DENTH